MPLPTVLQTLKDDLLSTLSNNQITFPSSNVTSEGLNWILQNVFQLNGSTASFTAASVTETSEPSVELTSIFQLFGSVDFDLLFDFSLDENSAIKTSMSATFPSADNTGGTLKLADLFSKLKVNAPIVPNLMVSHLKLSASKDFLGLESIHFSNSWVINIGANNLEVSNLGASLGYKEGTGFSGSLTGTITIDNVTIDVEYDIPGDFEINANIPSIDFRQLVNHFASSGSQFSYSAGFPTLTLNNAAFKISKTGDNYELNVDVADVNGWGEFEVDVQYVNQQWGFAAGFALHPDWNLSDISTVFNPVKNITFSDTGLIVASFADDKFAFKNSTVPLPEGGIIAGINFFATLHFPADTSSSLGVLGKLTGKQGASLQVLAEIPLSGISNTKLQASLGGSLYIPPTTATSNPSLSLQNPAVFITAQPSFGVSGTLNIMVKGQPVEIDGDVIVSPTEIGFNAYLNTSKLSKPAGFNGVVLEGIGVSLDLELETAACALALEGVFNLNGNKSNDEVAFKFAVAPEAIYPVYLKAKFPQLDLPTIYKAVMNPAPGHDLPKELGSISFQNLLIYWADQNNQLPDGTLLSAGFQFNAQPAIFFGFQANAAVQMDFNNGFTGSLNVVTPILIQNGNVLKITKAGDASQGPQIAFSTVKSPYFQASVDATLFKMANTSITAIIANKYMNFDMKNSIYSYLDSSINITVSANGKDFGFAFLSNINVNINCDVPMPNLGGMNIGTLHIKNTGFKGTVNCHLDISSKPLFSLVIQGGIAWEGKTWTMPSVSVSAMPPDLSNIPSLIQTQFKTTGSQIFSGLVSDMNEYLQLIKDGALSGGDSVTKVLMGIYSRTPDQVVSILKSMAIHDSVTVPVSYTGHVDTNSPHLDTPSIHGDTASVHGDTPRVHVDTNVLHIDTSHADGSKFGIHGDIPHGDKGGHTDNNTIPHGDGTTIPHVDSTTPHGDTTPHVDSPSAHIDQQMHIDV